MNFYKLSPSVIPRVVAILTVATIGTLLAPIGGSAELADPPASTNTCTDAGSAQHDSLVIGVIGDSYTGGTTMGGKGNDSWAEKLTGMLSADTPVDVQPIAYGGSGYINVGPFEKTYMDAVPRFGKYRPDIIVIFGSINDNGQNPRQLYDTASTVYDKARILFPDAQLMVVGPTWHLESQAVRDNSDAVLSAARDARIPTFDPLPEKWFAVDRDKIAADGVHPTSSGHTFMAERIAPHVQRLIDSQPNPALWTVFRLARHECQPSSESM